jgi:hypothetical protein
MLASASVATMILRLCPNKVLLQPGEQQLSLSQR